MVAVDASVLAYAVNRFAPEHARATRIVEELANGEPPWALTWPTVHEFLAFVTHPHAVVRPLKPGDAWTFMEGLLTSPSLSVLSPTEQHADVLAELVSGVSWGPVGLAGLEVAAVLREHGVRELLSTDRAMRRFGFLAVRDPVHGEPWALTARPTRKYRALGRQAR